MSDILALLGLRTNPLLEKMRSTGAEHSYFSYEILFSFSYYLVLPYSFLLLFSYYIFFCNNFSYYLVIITIKALILVFI